MDMSAILCLLLVLVSSPPLLAATLPIKSPSWQTQQLLRDAEVYRPTSNSNTAGNYLDAFPNTVGVLLMNNHDEGVHIWLPIGQRVFVHESTVIPAQPLTAKITSMVAAIHTRASVETLDRIMCYVYPRANAHSSEQKDEASLTSPHTGVAFSKQDGLVRLVASGGLLKEREVESYECVKREQLSDDKPESPKGFLAYVAAWFKRTASRRSPHTGL